MYGSGRNNLFSHFQRLPSAVFFGKHILRGFAVFTFQHQKVVIVIIQPIVLRLPSRHRIAPVAAARTCIEENPRLNVCSFQSRINLKIHRKTFQFICGNGNFIIRTVDDICVIRDTAPTVTVRKEVGCTVLVFKRFQNILVKLCPNWFAFTVRSHCKHAVQRNEVGLIHHRA